MTSPIKIIENPTLTFENSPVPLDGAEEVAVYPSGLVVVKTEFNKYYYPPKDAPVVRE